MLRNACKEPGRCYPGRHFAVPGRAGAVPGRGNVPTRAKAPTPAEMPPSDNTGSNPRRALALVVVLALALAGGTAAAQDLESERAAKQAELEEVKQRGDVLSTEISDYSDQISQLAGEVAILRSREAEVAQQLRETDRPARAREGEPRRAARQARPLARHPRPAADRHLQVRPAGRPDRDPQLRGLRRPRQPLRLPDPDPGPGREHRRPRAVPARRVARGGRADPHREAGDRGQEGGARAHADAARGARGRARRGPRPEGSRPRPGGGHRREARGRHLGPERADPGAARRVGVDRRPRTRFRPARSRAARAA